MGVGEWGDGSGWRCVTKGRWMGELYEQVELVDKWIKKHNCTGE